jgi:uncharacterized protein
MKSICSTVLVLMLLVSITSCRGSSSRSTNFDEGIVAARRGDFKTAMEIWKPLAEEGYPDAQFHVGYLFANGLGLNAKLTEAKSWYEQAAAQGNANAQYYLAGMYAEGSGVKADPVLAQSWLRKAALGGNTDAQNNLGAMYAKGSGSEEENRLSIRWTTRAAEGGNSIAQYNLGSRYLHGIGVERDDAQAFGWLRKSANKRNKDALNSLGIMFAHGRGTTSHPILAYVLYHLASAQDSAHPANTNLLNIANRLTPDQIAKAKEFVQSLSDKTELVDALDDYLAQHSASGAE